MSSFAVARGTDGARLTRFARRHGWAVLAGMAVAAIAVHQLLRHDATFQSVVYDLIGLVAVVAIVLGVWLHRPERPMPWLLFAAGQLSFVVGDVLWTVVASATGEVPFPSIADVAYLAGYPFLALAMVECVRLRVHGGDRAGLLDGAILAAGAAVVGWVALVDPVIAASSDLDPVALGISVAYPLADLVVIGVAFAFLATPGSRSLSFALLVASLGAIFLADVAFAFQTADGTFVDGSALDIVWLAGYALAGIAAMHPSMRSVAAPHPVPVAWLSYVRLAALAIAILVGPAVLLLQALVTGSAVPALAIGSGLLGLLVVLRLALVVQLLNEDVAARRRLEAELSFQATHDPLTGIANRRSFIARVALLDADTRREPFALLFIDLDDFKTINDRFGHVAGDEVLAIVARRIEASVRPTDLAARLGGDEFGILLLGADEARAQQVADRILAALASPIPVAGGAVQVRASVGIADSAGSDLTAEAMIHNSDVAMYQAKSLGKGRSQIFRGAPSAG